MAGRFGTVLTAMATPFLPDGGLDLPVDPATTSPSDPLATR